jgi:hypothetical protein
MHLKILILLTLLTTARSLAFETISTKQLAALENENFLIETKSIDGLTWPKVIAYLKIDASAKQAMAIFAAYDQQKNYVPNVIVSNPVKERSALSVDVEYELKLPWPIPNSRYTHGHEIKKDEGQEVYQINWWMIQSTSASKVEGSATFLEHNGQTYMKYISLVVPSSSFAGLLRKTMLKDVEHTLREIRKYIELNVKDESKNLAKYTQVLEQTLSGKSYWKTIID